MTTCLNFQTDQVCYPRMTHFDVVLAIPKRQFTEKNISLHFTRLERPKCGRPRPFVGGPYLEALCFC